MKDLLNRIRASANCRVLAVSGMPEVGPGYLLPEDLREFYEQCGGVSLFTDALFPISISSPAELVSANPVIIGEKGNDISDSWFIIGRGGGDEYVNIDLAPERLGTCYDSFYDVHGIPGSCAIIALSFTNLLERLLTSRGGHWYWLEPEFVSLGDAYDSVR